VIIALAVDEYDVMAFVAVALALEREVLASQFSAGRATLEARSYPVSISPGQSLYLSRRGQPFTLKVSPPRWG